MRTYSSSYLYGIFIWREVIPWNPAKEIAQVGEDLETTANLREDSVLPSPESF